MISPLLDFGRSNWYEAEYAAANFFNVQNWCIEHFGTPPITPDAASRWFVYPYHRVLLFRDEKDYIFFMLRWA